MPGVIKDIRQLEADIEAGGLRAITKQDILDILSSLAPINVVYSIKDGETPTNDFTLTSGQWNRMDIPGMDVAGSGGVIEGPNDGTDPGGWLEFTANGAGHWNAMLTIKFLASDIGKYSIRLTRVDSVGGEATTDYINRHTTTAVGEEVVMSVGPGKLRDLENNERLQFSIRGAAGAASATITVLYMNMWFFRSG